MTTQELQLDQYRLLRAEVLSLVDETRKLEILALGGIAALYAWLAAQAPSVAFPVWFVGVLLPLFGGLRSYALFARITLIADYLRELEEYLYPEKSPLIGWERRFQKVTPNRVSFTAMLYWAALLVVTIAGPFVLARR